MPPPPDRDARSHILEPKRLISTKTCQKANLKQFKKASFKFNTRWRKGAWTYLLTIMELACSIWSSPQVSTVAS